MNECSKFFRISRRGHLEDVLSRRHGDGGDGHSSRQARIFNRLLQINLGSEDKRRGF